MNKAIIINQNLQFTDLETVYFTSTNTLHDYDLLYIFPSSNWVNYQVNWQERVTDFLNEQKPVIVFCDDAINQCLGRITQLPISFNDGTGKKLNFSTTKQWKEFYEKNISNYSQYVDTSQLANPLVIKPILGATDTKIIAFKHAEKPLYFLPYIDPYSLFDNDQTEMQNELISLLTLHEKITQSIPVWVTSEQFLPQTVLKINQDIDAKKQKIESIKDDINKLGAKKQELLKWRSLLYEGNTALEDIVSASLELFGATIEPKFDDGTNELEHIFILKSKKFAGDSKGKTKGLQKSEISQLRINVAAYETSSEVSLDGQIIFLNHFKELSPEERGDPADQNLIELAKKFNIKIILTVDIYNLVKAILDGDRSAIQVFEQALLSQGYGVLNLTLQQDSRDTENT